MELARSLPHICGPGQGMWRVSSSSKSHVFLPETLKLPDSKGLRPVLVGTQPSGAQEDEPCAVPNPD